MRKYFLSSLIILIMAFTFCIGYFSVPQNIYADDVTDQWTSVTTNQELADAFRYYCKSRNLAVEGSVVDALTSFTTNSFNTICDTLGIDVTALQAHLKRSTDSNGKVQFLFDQFGVTAYNRIFAEFLQNNNLEVGDSANEQDNILYSGSIFTDADGNNCLVFVCNINTSSISNTAVNTSFSHGTPYKYNYNDVRTLVGTTSYSPTFHVTSGINFNPTWRWFDRGGNEQYITNSTKYNSGMRLYAKDINGVTLKGYPAIIYNAFNSTYYVGYFSNASYYNGSTYVGNTHSVLYMERSFVVGDNAENTIIFLTTNNLTINDNDYTDNSQTVINNEGDVYNYDYDDDDPPVNPPSGGGGDDPSGGGGDDDPIDWPNITFPNILPHLQIPNLKDKFPFSIPWDLIAFYAILNVDPVCPEIETDINLGVVQWHVDLSLEDFEPAAEICRDMYFIAFCVGLIIVTRDLIRG